MVRIDYHTLNQRCEDSGPPPDLLSDRYIDACCNVMNQGCPFWKNKAHTSDPDFKTTVSAMVNPFLQPPENGVTLMLGISKEILTRSPAASKLFQKCSAQIQMMTRLVDLYHIMHSDTIGLDELLVPVFAGLPSQAYQSFQAIGEAFQNLISKQVPALTIDASQGLLSQLSSLLRHIAAADDEFTESFLREHSIQARALSRDERELLLELVWKFDMLKRCILEGRMEIRVQGVEVMQADLVHIYTRYIQNSSNPKDHPIVQYLSNFMLANRLVEYFVGVDSHPQLIGRCGNIIGFLVITGNYFESHSDTIWRAVVNSADPRFVDALLLMLSSIFTFSSYPILLYLTTKVNELPVHLFDSSMIRFGAVLLDNLRRKCDGDNQGINMPPFHLCIRLIRQIAIEDPLDTVKRREIHQFAAGEFKALLHYGPSVEDRRAIYEECIRDISDGTNHATGSIHVMDALLSRAYEKELSSLIQDWDVARLIAQEFARYTETGNTTTESWHKVDDDLNIRLNLIQNLIVFTPDTITADVGAKLWEHSVGSKALNHQARGLAWMSFLGAIRKVTRRNSFIDRCIKDYLPQLHPKSYTEGCLYFAQNVSNYHYRIAHVKPEDVLKEPTAGDLLWQMSLAALPGTVESNAMNMLVAFYLDGPDTQRRSLNETEAIHIGVVERCVRQLTSAASRLKAYNEGTSSEEDEPMIIVAPEEEVNAHKLSFTRSLTILREFVRGVRSRPRYSPQIHKQVHISVGSNEVKGISMQIRYQPFGPGTSNDIRTIEVDRSELMRDFASRLKSLTSFAKLTMISGGQKLDLNKILDQTVGALKLDQKGLLLVKRDSDLESESNPSPSVGLRPVETEIMTHFSELYDLLAMEERLAKEASSWSIPGITISLTIL